MIIHFFGNQFFKFQVGDTVLATDPFGKESTLKGPKFGADIVLQSTLHEDMKGGEELTYGNKTPHVIKGPGEYEVSGTFIKGYGAHSSYDGIDSDAGTAYYIFELDGMRVLFLGACDDKKNLIVEGEIDILCLPISGDGRLNPKQAAELVTNVDPKIIIPMGIVDAKDEHLTAFIKEIGADAKTEIQEKLTIKKKDIESLSQKLYIVRS
ncbi:MAG: MBL fold metallo-hydrolase [Patescibacteria group bacterium]